VIAPSLGWAEGAEVKVGDWQAFKAPRPLAPGAAQDLALLKPAAPGVYRVERILPVEKVLGRVVLSDPGRR
jgi:hypothetical protein